MSRAVDSKVRVYASMVGQLPSYTDELEVEAAYLWREALANALDAGETLASEGRSLLQSAD